MSKNVIIPFKCTEQEKAALLKVAVGQNGLSIAEFMRYKLFNEPSEEELQEDEEDLVAGFMSQIEELEGLIKSQRNEIDNLQKTLQKTKSKENVYIIPHDLLNFINDFVDNDTPSSLDGSSIKNSAVEALDKESFITMCIQFFRQYTEPGKGTRGAKDFVHDFTTK